MTTFEKIWAFLLGAALLIGLRPLWIGLLICFLAVELGEKLHDR